jgi:hypothetical protein
MDSDSLKQLANSARRLAEDCIEMASRCDMEESNPSFFSVLVDCDLEEDERGNTLLVLPDPGGDRMNAWIKLDGEIRLEIVWRPENHPSLEVRLVRVSDEDLFQHLVKEFGSTWTVRRLNLGTHDEPELLQDWARKEQTE